MSSEHRRITSADYPAIVAAAVELANRIEGDADSARIIDAQNRLLKLLRPIYDRPLEETIELPREQRRLLYRLWETVENALLHQSVSAQEAFLKLVSPLSLETNAGSDPAEVEQAEGTGPAAPTLAAKPGEVTLSALLRVFTNRLADDRIKKAARLLSDGQLTTNEKLTRIDALIPLPPTASAEQLGEMLGVTKQAVLKTDWWIQNRRGEKDNEIGRRRAGHQKRAKDYEPPGTNDDDE